VFGEKGGSAPILGRDVESMELEDIEQLLEDKGIA
jgi:calpain-15